MSRMGTVAGLIAGAIAGAVVALIIAGTDGGKSVTTTVVASGSSASSGTSTSGSSTTPAQSGGTVPSSLGNGKNGLTINQIYRKDSPGVVDITVISNATSQNLLGQSESQQQEDEGAGVVYDSKGDILTDEHVVANETSIAVHFQNGVNAKARLVGEDASNDIAVIKVDVPASELHPIPFANSDDAQVGDPVVAIGSPFSLPETTTAGIVSAVGRSITAPNGFTILGSIQTDASINPGNSGGPLLDAAGDVLGLNDQIETNADQSAGVGFATPGNLDVQDANTFISGHKVQHAYVGVYLSGTGSGAQIATYSQSGSSGSSVVPGSPAAKAGLQPGDTVTAIDGQTVTSSDDFIEILNRDKPGQKVKMRVTGPGGNRTVTVTLGNRPASAGSSGG